MFTINKKYLLLTLSLFLIEVYIGMYVHDAFIRPYIGDLLVVILIYCFVKAFFEVGVLKAAIGVLLFSYVVEVLQYFKIVKLLGLQQSQFARIIIGTSFAWEDIVAYTVGIGIVISIELFIKCRD